MTIMTYNALGIMRGEVDTEVEPGRHMVVDFLSAQIAQGRPNVVGLQEVCESQVTLLVEALSELGHPMEYAFGPGQHSERVTRECSDVRGREDAVDEHRGGMALLVREPMLTSVVYTDTSSYRVGDDPLDEAARGICAYTAEPTTVRACVAHMSSDSSEFTAQFDALNLQWQLDDPMLPTILLGDFNATPTPTDGEPDLMSRLYSSEVTPPGTGIFREVSECGRDDPTAADGCTQRSRSGPWTYLSQNPRKIDYVFVDQEHFGEVVSSRVTIDEAECGRMRCSDHRMLWGWASLSYEAAEPGTVCEAIVMTAADHPAEVTVRQGEVPCFEATRIMQEYYLALGDGAAPGIGGGGPVEVGPWTCVSGPATEPGSSCVRDGGARIEAAIW
ncbi:exonuclease III [Actinoalloteichus hymeniacidonis]|uniref:Exonuclease III n=2 Tax=Actinoalloteichus hymeniacidonis TaxID=340345 RepID=A0AAC9MZ33_9PSEU|nr:exonuclease III [Actinoalloteichus hymeniacidonis]